MTRYNKLDTIFKITIDGKTNHYDEECIEEEITTLFSQLPGVWHLKVSKSASNEPPRKPKWAYETQKECDKNLTPISPIYFESPLPEKRRKDTPINSPRPYSGDGLPFRETFAEHDFRSTDDKTITTEGVTANGKTSNLYARRRPGKVLSPVITKSTTELPRSIFSQSTVKDNSFSNWPFAFTDDELQCNEELDDWDRRMNIEKK